MKFTKMHGIGNDYVYINGFEEKIENPSKLAIALSNRNFGVGSDGLIIIKPSKIADCQMEMYNLDGSLGAMCGNGIRCVAKFVFDKGLVNSKDIKVETKSGIKHLTISTDKNNRAEKIRVNMGEPILNTKDIPMICEDKYAIDYPIDINGNKYKVTSVSMGNPHTVVFVDEVKKLDLEKIGPSFEHNPIFPEGVNTEFVKVIDNKTLEMRVWERGSGETLACGTGACATVVAAAINKLIDENTPITVKLLGGSLEILWDKSSNKVFMTGPATTVFEGELNMEAIKPFL